MPSRTVHAACPHDCPDGCGVLITVDELSGRATKIQGDPAHPVTRGFLCAKVAKYLDRVYSPDRLLYPMQRRAQKGTGGPEAFERISWDAALAAIAKKLQQVSDEFGPEAILPYSYGGTLGALGNSSMDQRFFFRLGASQLDRTICATAGGESLISVLGKKLGTEPEQFAESKLILAWGANIHGANVHLWPFIEDARRKGAKLVVIDPYQTRTAKCADWYIPIHPGTDVALALGMMNVIIGEKIYDADYVARHTVGFDELRARVAEYPPEKVAQWTGTAAADIRKLARDYARVRPAAIRVNYGVQRSENGGAAVRAIAMLPCITGSWKEVGGGLQLSTSGAYGLNKQALERPELMRKSPLGRPARLLNMSELARVLNEVGSNSDGPPVKALVVYNSNPAAVAPNHNGVIRGLKRPDLFTVVHEQFFTDTTDYADIILPATTFFEHKDLQTAYGHYYLMMSHQAIAPLGESRSNVETFRALAKAMGFTDECFDEPVDEMIEGALSGGAPTLEGITREDLEREGHIRLRLDGSSRPTAEGRGPTPYLPFASGGFATPSGKAELYSATLAKEGRDPIASFVAPRESRHTEAAAKYPLELLGRKADNYLNSTFANLPATQAMEDPGVLEIHSDDAAARGIRDGQPVRVFNDRGAITLRAKVNGHNTTPRGVVATYLNWAKLTPGGQNINVLTSERLTDIGRGATFYSCLVEIARA
ncbi:MAG: molybdopterin-dependent oxidoreductase [Candidatus Koribacter versatilis]|uniref:Molybdopterin-dependent oxidoreductase n=1 Tax=Candidatus Korobacter versatilis TaxID=658062 RepID=A0A932A820_9BACT|nr:molybdopterin-dependent oxidoreductase [Candidatus Koribacter versatilis]